MEHKRNIKAKDNQAPGPHWYPANNRSGQICQIKIAKISGLLNDTKLDKLIDDTEPGNSSRDRRPNLFGNKEDTFYFAGVSIHNIAIMGIWLSIGRARTRA